MSILIKNGTLICPEGPVQADLRVEGERIAEIGPSLPVLGCQAIDAKGKLVFPGFIDTHTHFEMNKNLFSISKCTGCGEIFLSGKEKTARHTDVCRGFLTQPGTKIAHRRCVGRC